MEIQLRIKEGDGPWETVAAKTFEVLREQRVTGTGTSEEKVVWGVQITEESLLDWDAALVHVDQKVHVSLRNATTTGGALTQKFLQVPKDCAFLAAGRKVQDDHWRGMDDAEDRPPHEITMLEELGAEATLTARLMVTTESQ